MSDIFKAFGLITAIVVLVISLINQVSLSTALFRSAIVVAAVYVGGFFIYFISVIMLQSNQQAQDEKIESESSNEI